MSHRFPGFQFQGLIAAPHTPFQMSGGVHLDVVEEQAAHLSAQGVIGAFIGGTTGECHSLTLAERMSLTERWVEVTRNSDLKVIVHVGSNCLADAQQLARHAQSMKVAAIAAMAPCYFKPSSLDALLACTQQIASSAPDLPFYYYDIPSMTGIQLDMAEYLQRASSLIPNLVGLKYSNLDLIGFASCRQVDGGNFDMLWGTDELLLAALVNGATGAVGSTYNFSAPRYHRMMAAFRAGDLVAARREQMWAIQLVRILSRYGYMASARALMEFQGVPIGPPRLPHLPLSKQQLQQLRSELEHANLLESHLDSAS
jgi:N-acetylneuraminate lyase